MIILPSLYFGSIEYWAAMVQGGDDVVVDVGENYVKRSERNRTEIMTSGGVMQLSVQLEHANRPRQPMRAMRIDYSKRWPHQHLIAIESAYRSSPYFLYYGDAVRALYAKEWSRLVDLNMATLEAVTKMLKITMPRISQDYVVAGAEDVDLRKKKVGPTLCVEPYIQVFDDRMDFVGGLSILDLIMCEGPEAKEYLQRVDLSSLGL